MVVLPSHYAGSVCGRALSANPFSSIGFERRQNAMLAFEDADAFAEALLRGHAAAAARAGGDRGAQPPRHRSHPSVSATPSLGLRANAAQFALLVALNALVGGMVGLERSVLPLVGERDFKLTSTAAILAFVVAFGLAKAITNLAAGALADRVGRKRLLVLGWLVALPVPLLVGLAPSWSFIVAANILLGVNQGLAWSMTVVMKIDLAGPARRGLALGLNEAAGYLGVATTALATGALAATYAPRTVVWVGAALIAARRTPRRRRVRARHGRARRGRAACACGRHHGASARASRRPSGRQLSSTRCCARATRPGWSTTSTMRWPGD